MLLLAFILLSAPADAGWWRRGGEKDSGRRVEPVQADIAPAKADFVPFPDLAAMIAESHGVKRPERASLAPLPDLPDPDSLPRDAVDRIVERMGNHANWNAVAYGASGHRDPMDKVRAEWAKRDARRDVQEYFDKLTPQQKRIADAAFAAGLAELPNFDERLPEHVTLDWLERNYPPRPKDR